MFLSLSNELFTRDSRCADMKPSKPATPAKGTLSTIPTPLSVLAKLPVNGRAVVTEVIEDVV